MHRGSSHETAWLRPPGSRSCPLCHLQRKVTTHEERAWNDRKKLGDALGIASGVLQGEQEAAGRRRVFEAIRPLQVLTSKRNRSGPLTLLAACPSKGSNSASQRKR
jgi:hypothetical protein